MRFTRLRCDWKWPECSPHRKPRTWYNNRSPTNNDGAADSNRVGEEKSVRCCPQTMMGSERRAAQTPAARDPLGREMMVAIWRHYKWVAVASVGISYGCRWRPASECRLHLARSSPQSRPRRAWARIITTYLLIRRNVTTGVSGVGLPFFLLSVSCQV